MLLLITTLNIFELEILTLSNAACIIKQLKKWFSYHGRPEDVTIDNELPFGFKAWKMFVRITDFNTNLSHWDMLNQMARLKSPWVLQSQS